MPVMRDYTIDEVKQMDKEHLVLSLAAQLGGNGGTIKQGISELSRRTGISAVTIKDWLKLVRLEPETLF